MVWDEHGYQLIDWDCNPKYYADQLGLEVWRKSPSFKCRELKDCDPFYLYDIYFKDKTTGEQIERYFKIHWDYISVILSFGIKIRNLTKK